VPNDSDMLVDKWATHKNSVVLAGAEYVHNDKDDFVPPYWINHYTCQDKSVHIGILICLPTGVATNSTDNVSFSLQKDCTELVITVKMHACYTELKMLKIPSVVNKLGADKKALLKNSLEKTMFNMRASVHDPFFFTVRIPLLGFSVRPIISDDDWHFIADKYKNRGLLIILKTPTDGTYAGQQVKKAPEVLEEEEDE